MNTAKRESASAHRNESYISEQLVRRLADVQGSVDTRQIPIDKVGIKDIRHPVRVKDRQLALVTVAGSVIVNPELDEPSYVFLPTSVAPFIFGHGSIQSG